MYKTLKKSLAKLNKVSFDELFYIKKKNSSSIGNARPTHEIFNLNEVN